MNVVVPLNPINQLRFAVRTVRGNTDSLRSVGLLLLVNYFIILYSVAFAVTHTYAEGIARAILALLFACFSIGVIAFASAETKYFSGYRHRWGIGISFISLFAVASLPAGIFKLAGVYTILGIQALQVVLSVVSIFTFSG